MNPRISLLALVTMLAAGCASAPDQSSAVAPSFTDTPAETVAAVTEAPTSIETLTPDDLRDPGSVVSCRQMLKPASNIIERVCLTADGWKIFEAALAEYAQRMLRMWQGGAYR